MMDHDHAQHDQLMPMGTVVATADGSHDHGSHGEHNHGSGHDAHSMMMMVVRTYIA